MPFSTTAIKPLLACLKPLDTFKDLDDALAVTLFDAPIPLLEFSTTFSFCVVMADSAG
jgi:hypothetical protein